MDVLKKSKWIWALCPKTEDQYTEYVEILGHVDEKACLNISSDTDYTVFINDTFVASNQYGDYEHYKIYDSIDITYFLTKKENKLKIIAYHCGVNTQRYRKAEAGLIYEVVSGEKIIAYSSESTLSRLSPTYVSGNKRFVSTQLGFTFSYDATKEQENNYFPSICVDKTVKFYKRPIKKLKVFDRCNVESITKADEKTYLIDLGKEVVGLATLDIISSGEQKIKVAYGESLDNGRVRDRIHDRSFFFEYVAKDGRNLFTDYMLRLSCRYLEITAEKSIKINYVGLLPQAYEVEEKKAEIISDLDKQIYDICVNTLRLCMMEHYVDTPWREQCLYAFDSRNQMLCGYYTFCDGNKDYARASLKLICEDTRKDGLLSICYPCGTELAIPSFSLYYLIAMREYCDYTGDISLVKEYKCKMERILDEFIKNSDGGLIKKFPSELTWNFYDWSEYLEGALYKKEEHVADLIINCLFVMALDAYEIMCKKADEEYKYVGLAESLRSLVKEEFTDDGGVMTLHKGRKEYTELGNALAVLCGAVTGESAALLCDKIINGEFTPSSLSMNIWKYEALISVNGEKYKEFILDEIRANYKKMLDAGSTTVWETLEGSAAFGNAGSLCHGWSAVPVYVFHKLGVAK
ncbi:MAG: family 78 glycoside hydrolase catalytic domain [Clostridia bacterium]|nr:family 78 glycoside hydrolase catalytic domain [Clostridia bacterium]